jgi:hypothetical protein
MSSTTSHRFSISAVAALLAILALGSNARADSFPILGAAGNFAVLALAGGNLLSNNLVTVNGNEGAVYNSSISNSAPSVINGNVYVSQTSQYSGPGTLNGSLIANSTLMGPSGTVQTAVNNAINTINGYSFPTSGPNYFGSGITGTANITINANPGVGSLTEVFVNGDINLNNTNLTLNGSSNQYFVVDVTGNLDLTGTASLLLSGGITSSNVIYYFSNSNCSFTTHVGDTTNGIFLAPSAGCNLTSMDGVWNSEIISAGSIQLLSGAKVNSPTVTAPEPNTFSLLAIGLLGLAAFSRRRVITA